MAENALQRIFFGWEELKDLESLLQEKAYSGVVCLVDENTHDHCLPELLQRLEGLGDIEIIEIEAGEDSKSPEVLIQIWHTLSELNLDRHALVVNLGGGVVSDLGGFVASTYLRGVDFINFPTSLLAMVDASIGGKTGINLQDVKNRVGVFTEPERVYIMPDFLRTLPHRELLSGYAEMLKHGLIADADYWDILKDFEIATNADWSQLIMTSVKIKAQIVSSDFRESGLRKALNFGHTIGHAIESASQTLSEPLLHGEAVVLGMMVESYLSNLHLGMEIQKVDDIITSLQTKYPKLRIQHSNEELMRFIKMDKKNNSGSLNFSLLENVGMVKTDVSVPEEKILIALDFIRERL